MSDHYYTNDPNSKSNPHTWEYELTGQTFRFTSDSGVFSKDKIDFGSQLLIETVVNENMPEGDLLDVGCGYGPIGIALAKAFPEKMIDMVDVNHRAIELAKENAQMNNVSNCSIFSSDIYENVSKTDYAAVISNPPIRAGKKVVHQILTEAKEHLKGTGSLYIVIQRKQGAPSAQEKMAEIFGNVERIALDAGYWILKSTK
ncbi:class I SAM-dependent methyltransferase [Lacticigenium naphthae]|uniref:class I SAM-dependent methyltransferase n=1 Tax=Lacticigenium naphthae TaxID=515351 RepID=UPI0004000A47|nr:class I SAM-dependent methyltransferase [Lacticigenium naphthae]